MVYKFDELFKWQSGKPIKEQEGIIPIYGSNGIIGYTDKSKFKNKIILGRVGAYCGSVEYCESEFNATDNTLITECNEDLITYRYAYYLLKLYDLNKYAGGAAQPLITQSILKHLKCSIPSIEIQNSISNFLFEYDNLIENNNKRISLLEQIAEEIYKEWFIRFRFPGHESVEKKESRIGKIPSSFNIKNIGEVLDYYIGGGWGNDDSSEQYSEPGYVIRGTDFESARKCDISSIPYRYHKKSNIKTRKLQENDLIIEISGGTQEQPVGRTIIVTKDLLESVKQNCICASFCKLIRCSQNISPIYFQYWMKYLYDTRIIDRYQLQSTGIINFKFEYFIKRGFVLIPPEELINQFEKIIIPIQNEIGKLGKENQNLIKQRDLLLPRLMSGKLEVK